MDMKYVKNPTKCLHWLLLAVALSVPLMLSRPVLAQNFVCVETNMGEFCMELLRDAAPGTVTNFLKYVQDGDYNNTFIHRTEPNFVIQGGGYKLDPLGEEIPLDPQITNEFGVSNVRATVAMAKFAGEPNSAANEWFVNLTDNSDTLDLANGGYTVFARVIRGMAVVDAIGRSLRVDLTSSLGNVFSTVPVLRRDDDGVGLEDLVQVVRVYTAETVTPDTQTPSEEEDEAQQLYQCTADWITSLAPSRVCMNTTQGEFCLDLYTQDAPLTVANFLHYVADGDYDNTFIHRSVPGFVIQGGGFKVAPLWESVPTDATVTNEFKLSNQRGTLAMAKIGGDPNSATSQWFVNLTDNANPLDTENGGYTVFGKVDDAGMEVIDRITALPTFDLSAMLGDLTNLPLQNNEASTGLNTGKLVRVTQAWIPGAGPNPCLIPKPQALAEYAERAFNLPVRVGDKLYHLYFIQDFTGSGYVFSVDFFTIVEVADKGQEAALFDQAAGLLTVPSMLVGQQVLRNLRFRLTNAATLQFTLDTYE